MISVILFESNILVVVLLTLTATSAGILFIYLFFYLNGSEEAIQDTNS